MTRHVALVPAAGVGARFGAATPKQYVRLAGKTVLQHSAEVLLACDQIDAVAIVVSAADGHIDSVYPSSGLPEKLHILHCGGDSRAETVRNGTQALLAQGLLAADDWLLVHDAARCCLPATALQRLLDAVAPHPVGGLLAMPLADTLKRANGQHSVAATLNRSHLWQAQTPQMFRAGLLQQALADADLNQITDESSAVEALGLQPLLVEGDSRNFKLTRAQDAILAECLLRHSQESA
ncbi:2-C-methyl-D-erythritol 4-phosphate cytidylyltransferase [Paralysiella testudinis]|uniref:2-C-methyl-D-erythritol 4-phosphate cytidylyltransferase n=1 Tax=Paralysiella testudinis TaxID=2809020 RepID=A0A892ZLM0_9NEIS|nr:2-C-methyl-D-erythritol 4-phosphate cytidylyltransferase [Paralysiella testudinis]QRQ83288.1 2-C-methyl-D-erythritol 4-phosphate cytidylyltransferase [Paralysiella testudinis]